MPADPPNGRPARRWLPALRRGSWRWMPTAVLLLTLGVAAAAIWEARRASIADHDSTRTLVKGHGAFAAWTFGRRAEERLSESFASTLARIRTGDAAGWWFRVPLDGGAPAWRGGPDAAGRARIADEVRAHARTAFRPEWRFAVLQAGGMLVVYARGDGADGPAAYGFPVDADRLAPALREIFAREPLLPPSMSGGRPNAEMVIVQVLAPDGKVLFASPGELWSAGTTEALGPEFGGMKVHASILNAAAYDLILGRRPPSRLPLLAGLLALAFVTGAVAVALLRREAGLARLRSDFVSSVSHELRTPLAQIRLFLETLRLKRYRTDEQREWMLENIDRESFRLAALVDNILLFSRGERGAPAGSRSPVDLAPWLRGLVDDFAPLAALRGARIETDVPPGLHAPLDVHSFRQVMLNLLDNAVKYGPEGQTVRVSARAASGNLVHVSVEDEGPGIPPREREAVWAPFRRGGKAMESAVAGSGIGLAVAREIVGWHGGTAWVEDGADGGARFVVQVPRAAPPSVDAPREVG